MTTDVVFDWMILSVPHTVYLTLKMLSGGVAGRKLLLSNSALLVQGLSFELCHEVFSYSFLLSKIRYWFYAI